MQPMQDSKKNKRQTCSSYLADIVILGTDLFSVPDWNTDIPVATTIVQGGIKFSLNN